MAVQAGTNRVVWIDFGRAQTFPYGPLEDFQDDWVKADTGLTAELMQFLTEDVKEGKLVKAWGYYYPWA